MSQVKLSVDGKEFDVLHCQYGANRGIDPTGKPIGEISAGTINLVVRSSSDTFFWEWAINKFEKKKGSVVFSRPDTDQSLKELQFEDALVYQYREATGGSGEDYLIEEVSLTARKISINNATHENKWPA